MTKWKVAVNFSEKGTLKFRSNTIFSFPNDKCICLLLLVFGSEGIRFRKQKIMIMKKGVVARKRVNYVMRCSKRERERALLVTICSAERRTASQCCDVRSFTAVNLARSNVIKSIYVQCINVYSVDKILHGFLHSSRTRNSRSKHLDYWPQERSRRERTRLAIHDI